MRGPGTAGAVGIPPYADGGYVRRVLEVRGRRSGQVHQVPIAVVSLNGSRYVVSPTRARNWVRNLRADPACTLVSRDHREPGRAVLIEEPGEVANVAATYLALMNAPWAVAQFPFPADADRARIRSAANQVAVFRIDNARPDHKHVRPAPGSPRGTR